MIKIEQSLNFFSKAEEELFYITDALLNLADASRVVGNTILSRKLYKLADRIEKCKQLISKSSDSFGKEIIDIQSRKET